MPEAEPGQLGRAVHYAEALFPADAQRPAQHPANRGHRVVRGGPLASVRCDSASSTRPASVSSTRRVLRTNSGVPSSVSSALNRRGHAGLGDLQQLRGPGEVGLPATAAK